MSDTKSELAQLRAVVEHLTVSLRAIEAGRIEGARTDGEYSARIAACEDAIGVLQARMIEIDRRKTIPTPQMTPVAPAPLARPDSSVEVEKTKVIWGAIPAVIKALLAGGAITAIAKAIDKIKEVFNK